MLSSTAVTTGHRTQLACTIEDHSPPHAHATASQDLKLQGMLKFTLLWSRLLGKQLQGIELHIFKRSLHVGLWGLASQADPLGRPYSRLERWSQPNFSTL